MANNLFSTGDAFSTDVSNDAANTEHPAHPLQRGQQSSIGIGGVTYTWDPTTGKYRDASGRESGQMGAPAAPAAPAAPKSDYLGFGTNATEDYFEKNPTDAFQFYVNKLGGLGSTLGRYASARFGEVYANYLKSAAANPNLLWTDYLNQYAQGGQLGGDFLGTAPQLRGQGVSPWAAGRFLG